MACLLTWNLGCRVRFWSAGRASFDAVELYQTQAADIPEDVVAQMRHAPFRPAMEAIAHTLAYEAAIIGHRSLPSRLLAAVTIPALIVSARPRSAPRASGRAGSRVRPAR